MEITLQTLNQLPKQINYTNEQTYHKSLNNIINQLLSNQKYKPFILQQFKLLNIHTGITSQQIILNQLSKLPFEQLKNKSYQLQTINKPNNYYYYLISTKTWSPINTDIINYLINFLKSQIK